MSNVENSIKENDERNRGPSGAPTAEETGQPSSPTSASVLDDTSEDGAGQTAEPTGSVKKNSSSPIAPIKLRSISRGGSSPGTPPERADEPELFDGDNTPLIGGSSNTNSSRRGNRIPSAPLVIRHARHRSTASGSTTPPPRAMSPGGSRPPEAADEMDFILTDDPERPKPRISATQFLSIVDSVRDAISHGVFPVRAHKGSSGAYFARDRTGKIVGVFKPRDEEPYGKGNPKLIKWLHRTFCGFCFGRSCLIPNVGYVSEAGASYIDRRLGLDLVPRTEVVSLAAPTFHYSKPERWAAKKGWAPLPPKVGSFQIFLDGYVDASLFFSSGYDRASFLHHGQGHPLGWDNAAREAFRGQFERLVVLDVLIRNTDRSLDNLLVKDETDPDVEEGGVRPLTRREKAAKGMDSEHSLHSLPESSSLLPSQQQDSRPSTESTVAPSSPPLTPTSPTPPIHLGAIDNGLAFPWKHPDNWRSYPPAWSFLPLSHFPFAPSTSDALLGPLQSNEWWARTLSEIEALFRLDPDFDEAMWRRQKAVLRGQAFGIVEVLRRARMGGEGGTPHALANRKPVLVFEEEVDVEVADGGEEGIRRTAREIRRRFEALARHPCFTRC